MNSEEGGGAWCPSQSARPGSPSYLEIDLIEDYVISSVVIQGRHANGLGKEYASHFMLKFWRNGCTDFSEYRDENGELILKGNVNSQDTREIMLTNAIVIGSKLRHVKNNIVKLRTRSRSGQCQVMLRRSELGLSLVNLRI